MTIPQLLNELRTVELQTPAGLAVATQILNQFAAQIRAETLDRIAIWLDGFDFPEAAQLAEQTRHMAKDAIEDAAE